MARASMKNQIVKKQKEPISPEPIPRLVYTAAEAGTALRRDKSWIYRTLYTGELKRCANFGNRAMISAAELERFVSELGDYKVRNIGRRAHKSYRKKEEVIA
jgi:hypothetical protein